MTTTLTATDNQIMISQPTSTRVKAAPITTTNSEVNVSFNTERQNDEISWKGDL